MKVLSAPEKVTLNLTNQCNLHCHYCAVSYTKNAPGDLTLEQWKAVIDELAQIKVFHLLISGGEPFLRQDLLSILKHIDRYPFRITINTNATLITEGIISHLSRSKRLDHIQVSLDGPETAIHDRIRGHDSFNKLLVGIELLHRYEIPFCFFVVIHKKNRKHIGKIIRFAENTGAYQVAFSSLLPQGSALNHLKELVLSFEEEKEVEAELRQLKRINPQFVGGTLMQAIGWMDEVSQIAGSQKSAGVSNYITSCGGSVSECAIRPDGEVIPCDRLWEYTVGNVKDDAFQNIWLHAEKFVKFRERYRRRMDSFKECRGCVLTDVCKGGCPATAFGLGRGIDGWDPLSCYQVFIGRKENTISTCENYGTGSGD